MTSNWRTYIVSELEKAGLLRVEDGNHGEYRPRQDEFAETGTPFLRAAHMDKGRILFESASRINETALSRIRKGIGCPGDTLLSSKGTVGKVALAPLDCESFVCSPQVSFWRSLNNNFLDYRFLYYYIQSSEFWFQVAVRSGETDMAPYISLTNQRQFKITIPELEEQKAIAHLLGTLDDKIELNQQMNRTLEAIAQAIFKFWFVEFDPVRAKMEGRQPEGMDAATADLFPDSFEYSPLGKIPKGWGVGTLDEEFKITMGQSPPSSTYNEIGDGIPFYQGRRDFGFRYPTVRVYCHAPTRFANAGDILVSVRAPVGDINMANQKCCIGRGVAAVRHATGSRSYTYYSMLGSNSDFARYEAEGTVFGSINKKDFNFLSCTVPPPELVLKCEALLYSLDQRIENQEQESNTLASIRDTLLPKLLSGKIRIKEPEKLVETVA